MSSMYLVRIEELDGSRETYHLLFHDRQRARDEVASVARKHMAAWRQDYPDDLESEADAEAYEYRGDLIRDDDEFYLVDTVRATVERIPVVDQP